jgi:hypothetical protein
LLTILYLPDYHPLLTPNVAYSQKKLSHHNESIMPLLNETISFTDLSNEVRGSFTAGQAKKVLLPAGTSLFRFSGHNGISPVWAETNQLGSILLAAKASGKRLDQYVREKLAVLRLWNPGMTYLIVAELTQPVWGFRGLIEKQNEAAAYMNNGSSLYKKRFTKPVFFSGGIGQVQIPGLNQAHLRFVVPAETILIHDPIDEILDVLIDYKVI